jgi:hypothetical protein
MKIFKWCREPFFTGSATLAAGSRYISSARAAQKTPLPPIILLFGDVALRAARTENTVPLLRVQSLLR